MFNTISTIWSVSAAFMLFDTYSVKNVNKRKALTTNIFVLVGIISYFYYKTFIGW
jgi:uncharacterized membrane protein (UPF0136 family)